MIELMIDLQGGAKAPLYEKIYEYIKNEIVDGKISQGEKLPSTRLLAKNLSVSRSTVELAYDQLLAEGYIESQPCSGFFVCDIRELYQLGKRAGTEYEKPKESRRQKETSYIDFSPYAIDTEHFPYNVWRKMYRDVLLDDKEELLLSGNGQGILSLRSTIADYLHQARGVNCNPSQIVIGAGNEYLELLLAQVLGQGKRVLMEDPGYLQAYHTFCNAGYETLTLQAGDGGIPIERIEEIQPDIIYMMPSHQFPLGNVMPLKKRLELLKWASEAEGRYIIEDDHDSEYRYRGKPIPSLQSIDHEGRVIYLGTFSKSIAPSIRISYMVLPQGLLQNYQEKCGFYSTTVPKIQQEVLREFMEEGHFGRHLNKMRAIYKGRHDFLTAELKKYGWVKSVHGDHAGLHVLVEVDTDIDEEIFCAEALSAGVKVTGLLEHYIEKPEKRKHPVLLLGYGKLSEQEMKRGLAVLDETLGKETEKGY